MAKLESLIVDLEIETAKLRAGLDSATKQIRAFTQQAKESADQAGEGFTILKGVMANLATEGIGLAKDAMKECITAFAEGDKIERQLEWAVGENAKAFKTQAGAMRDSLGVSDDSVMRLQMLAARYGVNHSQIERLTKAVLDYSSATGNAADEAMQKLMRGIEAGGAGLRKMGIHYESTGRSAQDLDLALGVLEKRWGGAAKASADSFGGSLEKMKQQLDELAKAFGRMIASVESKTGIIGKLTEAMQGIGTALDQGFDSQNTPQANRTREITALMEKRISILANLRESEEREKLFYGGRNSEQKVYYQEAFRQVMTYTNQLVEVDAALKKMKASADAAGKAAAGITTGGDDKDHAVERKEKQSSESIKKWFKDYIEAIEKEKKDELEGFREGIKAELEYLEADLKDLLAARAEMRELTRLSSGNRLGTVSTATSTEPPSVIELWGRARMKDINPDATADQIRRYGAEFAEQFRGGLSNAGQIILNSAMSAAPKFGSMMQGAIQGLQAGGIWGAIIGAVAALLSQTKAFGVIMGQVEQGMSLLVSILEPILKPLAALNVVANVFLSLLKPLGWVLELINKATFIVIRVVGLGVLDIILGMKDFWNGIVLAVSNIFYDIASSFSQIPVIGESLSKAFTSMADTIRGWTATNASVQKARDDLANMTWENITQPAAESLPNAADGADKFADTLAKGTEEVKKYTSAITNAPTGFRVESYRYGATNTKWQADMPTFNIYIGTDQIDAIVRKREAIRNFRLHGSPA